MDDLKSALILSHKLINTIVSPSFVKGLDKPWLSNHPISKVEAVRNKVVKSIKLKISRELRDNNQSACYQYLNGFEACLGLKLSKSEKKGLVTVFVYNDYLLIDKLLREASRGIQLTGRDQAAQFECHELLSELRDFLFIKDTIENGSGHKGLDVIIEKWFSVKPVSFFANGYVSDLFISDRLACLNPEAKITHISCMKEYLSTFSLDSKEVDGYACDGRFLAKLVA